MFKKNYLPILMWILPLSFFAYQFILRLWPGLMFQQIMSQFAVDAAAMGLLASLYYYGYATMQIPVAIMLDKYGAKYIIFTSAIICGISTLIFLYTEYWYIACTCRLFIGIGSAVGFLGVSKVISQWFSKEKYTKMVGYSFTIGLMGAIYGGRPISILIENYSWQKVSLVLALISILIGILIYLFLRSPENSSKSSEEVTYKASMFYEALSSKTLWFLAIANFLMVGSLEGFADVWGVSYLMVMFQLSKTNAAELISFIFIGMIFGGPLLAILSKKYGDYKVISLCGIGMAALISFIFFNDYYNWYLLASIFFMIGILCCYQVIVFSAGSNLFSLHLLGVTVAFLNSINMLGGSFFHTIIGYLMDLHWTGRYDANSIKIYDIFSYHKALIVIPICAVIGAAIIAFIGLNLYLKTNKTNMQNAV